MKKKVNVKGNIRRMALLVAGCVVMGGMAASQTGGNMAYAMTKEEAERQKDDASENGRRMPRTFWILWRNSRTRSFRTLRIWMPR